MAHQNLTFDSFHSLDNAQASFMLSNPSAYNNYAGNLSQYSSGSSHSSNGWGSPASSGFNSSAQPRSANPAPPHHTHPSGYINNSYPSYASSSPPYALSEPHRTHGGYHNSHPSLGSSHRSRSDQDIYSMLPSVLTDIPTHRAPPSAPASVGRGAAWNTPRTGNPLQGFGPDIPYSWSPLSADSNYASFESSWSDTVSSTSSPDMMHMSPEYNYTLEVSSVPPPQPRSAAAFALRHVSPTSTRSSSPSDSRRSSMDAPTSTGKSCSHCHATSTPLWRREPNTLKPLCNACGLYLQQRNKHRPQELIDADAADDSEESDGDGSGPECSHCHTHHTSVWRRSKTGAQLCNACGVYSRLRGRDRPLSLKRNKIKPRSKHTPSPPTIPV
ncbi:hypothetical protein DXG01_006185 [Tephrocybe rancida]|nr:hypothetical protein DXG01_006185 [Tephrocybe rancida]